MEATDWSLRKGWMATLGRRCADGHLVLGEWPRLVRGWVLEAAPSTSAGVFEKLCAAMFSPGPVPTKAPRRVIINGRPDWALEDFGVEVWLGGIRKATA